jgi:hypothetical protein
VGGVPDSGSVSGPTGTAGSRGRAAHPIRATVADYARDAVAAALLLVSLFMTWVSDTSTSHQLSGLAAAHIDVLLVTMITVAALSIPHLGRGGAFGTGWDADAVRRARLLIALPYAVLVVVYLVLALVAQLTLGPAMAYGMAGAILTAQPRQRELPTAGRGGRGGRVWVMGTLVVSALAVIFTLVQIAEMFAIFSANGPAAFILSIVLGLSASAVLAVVAGATLAGNRAWRRIGIGLGGVAVVFILFSLNPQLVLVNATLHGPAPTFTLMFWIAFGAAASAPALARRLPSSADAGAAWFRVVRIAVGLAIACGILVVVVAAIELSYQQLVGPMSGLAVAEWMIALAVGVLVTAGGVTVWAIGRTQTRAAVQAITVFAGIMFVLGLILIVVWSLPSALPFGGAGTLAPLIAFAFPFALAGGLWLAPSSRAWYATLPGRIEAVTAAGSRNAESPAEDLSGAESSPADEETSPTRPYERPLTEDAVTTQTPSDGEAAGEAGIGEGEHPSEPRPSETAEEKKRIIAEAADPATPATRLHELAAIAPYTRPALARNPATYAALVEWLSRLGDPDVDAALAGRSTQPNPGDQQ